MCSTILISLALALAVQAETPAPRLRAPALASRSAVGAPMVVTSEAKPLMRDLRGGNGVTIPRELQLVIGAAGIFFSFSVFAVLQARRAAPAHPTPHLGTRAAGPQIAARSSRPAPSKPLASASQEDVYKKAYGGEYFAFTFFALVIERGVNALTAYLGNLALGPSGHKIPHKEIFNSGISQMLAMAASNEALRYVSFPTQVRRGGLADSGGCGDSGLTRAFETLLPYVFVSLLITLLPFLYL